MGGTTADGWPYVTPDDHPLQFPAHSQALANLLQSRAVPGNVVYIGSAAHADINVSTVGIRDLSSAGNGVTFPFPTTSFVVSSLFAGFSTGTTTFVHELFAFSAAAVVRSAPAMQSVASQWAGNVVTWSWTNAAGAGTGAKVRVNPTAIASGAFHTSGTLLLAVIAT